MGGGPMGGAPSGAAPSGGGPTSDAAGRCPTGTGVSGTPQSGLLGPLPGGIGGNGGNGRISPAKSYPQTSQYCPDLPVPHCGHTAEGGPGAAPAGGPAGAPDGACAPIRIPQISQKSMRTE